MFVYLDNSATTRQYDQVTDAMAASMRDCFGNPSSLHAMGLAAEKEVRKARKAIASSLACHEDEIIFTSGGTESDNMALLSTAQARRREGKRIITTRVEHPAVLETCKVLERQGFELIYIDVDERCRLNFPQLKAAINDETILISVMAVNNEVGTIMPLRDISEIKKRAIFHTDAVQGLGKTELKRTGADMISLSAHKIHGPKGVGALYVRKGVTIPAFINGGGQEKHRRSGTENVPGITGFGMASQIAEKHFDQRVSAMAAARRRLFDGLCDQISDIRVNSPEDGAASVLNVSFLGCRGEVLLHTLEQDQIYVSTGSACSSNKKGRSHVLAAMGLSDKEIEGAIRFSFNEFNTAEEMDYVIDRVKTAVNRFRKLGSFR
ncbi:cysteine desulfurase family protein [Ihubacter sp. rT4E-8]|uniref:cysteine desulfurase family protein n=1 Tax=Ihubacter sp. rT4E-8 TaxID=3242369 RepID=UPI003CF02ECA